MQDLLANGVPLFRPNGHALGWLRTHSSAQALDSLRQISLWSQQHFGLPPDHRLIGVLGLLCQPSAALKGVALAGLPQATGLAVGEVQAVLQVLQARAEVDIVAGAGGHDWVRPQAGLVEAWMAFQQQLNQQWIARPALRQALLLNQASAPALAQQVETLFDCFFDLGWLYLHNWGASCHLMASLVCAALRQEGQRARIEMGYVEICHQGGRYLLGGKGLAQAGQVEGHVFCVLDDAVVVDFGLGVARRLYRRDMYWAVAADALWASEVAARIEHPRFGVMSWRTDFRSPRLQAELSHVAPLVKQLMPVYAAARSQTPAGSTTGLTAGSSACSTYTKGHCRGSSSSAGLRAMASGGGVGG